MPYPEVEWKILTGHRWIQRQIPYCQEIGAQNERPGRVMTLPQPGNNHTRQDIAGKPHVEPGKGNRIGDVIKNFDSKKTGIGIRLRKENPCWYRSVPYLTR